MPEETAPVVSSATETPAAPAAETPSSDSTQASSETTQAPPENATAQEKIDWRAKLKEDPELQGLVNAERQKAIDKAKRKWERDNARLTAKDIAEKEDVEAALQFARSYADAPDEDDDDTPKVGADHLKRETILAKGFHNTPEYKALWAADQAGMTKQFATLDAPAFEAYVREKGLEILIESRASEIVKKQLPDYAKALATEQTNAALQNVAVPLSGGGAAVGALTLDRYNSDAALRAELRKTPEGRKKIDEMMARAAGG